MANTLVVLAAGIGRRFGGFKQIVPVGPSGEFIIDYSLYDAVRAGFDRVVFLISREVEKDFRTTVGARAAAHLKVEYILQDLAALPAGYAVPQGRTKPWGTGHAVLCCQRAVDTPFAVINGDDFYGRRSYEILHRHLDETAGDPTRYCMVGYGLRNTVSDFGAVARGVCHTDAEGNLTHIVERTRIEKTAAGIRCLTAPEQWESLSGDEIVSLNLWGFKPSIFPFLEDEFRRFLDKYLDKEHEFFMPSVVDKMIKEQRATVRVLPTPSMWTGVTYPQDREEVVRRIRALVDCGEYPSNLWA